MEEKEIVPLKWYEKHWVIWIFTIFLAPVGLFMMWRFSRHGLVVKILATLFFGGAFLVSLTGNSNSTSNRQIQPAEPAPQKTYYSVDVETMMNDLNNNAAAAQKKYKGQNLAVTGIVMVIDSDGNYFSLFPNQYSIIGVNCNINKRDKTHEDFLLRLKKGQTVTVYGNITDVGEVFGYTLKVDKF